MIYGHLFEDKHVSLDERTVNYGGSFQGINAYGVAQAWDQPVLKFMFDELRKNPAPVMWDVRANTGSFTLLATHLEELRVVAFEPNPPVFDVLKSNCEINDLTSRVRLFPIVLNDCVERVSLHVPDDESQSGMASMSNLLSLPYRALEHDSETINRVWKLIEKVGWAEFVPTHLKIDVEGAELLVLLGADQVLSELRPALLLEVDARWLRRFGYSPQDVFNYLDKLGYRADWIGKQDVFACPE